MPEVLFAAGTFAGHICGALQPHRDVALRGLLRLQAPKGRGSKKGGRSAAGAYRCIVCDSSLDDLSSHQPMSRDSFQPNSTLTPELFFDGPQAGASDRRPPSARSASPPDGRTRALQ